MFYYNARYAFKLPAGVEEPVSGGIIAASGLPAHTLLRRRISTHSHLQHRLFDPQLYMAGLSATRAPSAVSKLATYPWFGAPSVPAYDSTVHGRQSTWAAMYKDTLLQGWPATVPQGSDVRDAIRAAVSFQEQIGAEGVILPAPLTRVTNTSYDAELEWVDLGLEVCEELGVRKPIYATVAIADVVLRGVPAATNPMVHLITDQITSRPVSGIYLVVEQGSEDGYCCGDRSTLDSILTIVDDCVRGANLRVILNYASAFGAVASAVGADVWSSGYYLSQRRFRLSDAEQDEGEMKFAYPRYYSLQLAADIGIKKDLARIANAGLLSRIFTRTEASRPLRAALDAGQSTDNVPEWTYAKSNIQAASAHYVDSVAKLGAFLETSDKARRIRFVSEWLTNAVDLAIQIQGAGVRTSRVTELTHQQTWLDVFQAWRSRAGV